MTDLNNLDTMTQNALKEACAAANLPTYGTKSQLIERLKAQALAEITGEEITGDESDAVVEADNPAVVHEADAVAPDEVVQTVAPKVITKLDMPAVVNKHSADVDAFLSEMVVKYPQILVKYNSNDECFTMDGGKQGRITTTARQPLNALRAVADTYANVMRGRGFNDIGKIG